MYPQYPLALQVIKWSHPFVELKFERVDCDERPEFSDVGSTVFWKGDVYVSHLGGNQLCKYSVTRNTWDDLPTPFQRDTTYYSIAVYQSKLLLIGGTTAELAKGSCSGKVWEFNESGESGSIPFKESPTIPPLDGLGKYTNYQLAKLSVAGGDNYLVVSHRSRRTMIHLEIYDGHSWSGRTCNCSPLCSPSVCSYEDHRLLIHNDTIFMIYLNDVYKASANLLTTKGSSEGDLWQKLEVLEYVPGCHNTTIHNGQIVALYISNYSKELSCFAFASCPDLQTWMKLGKSKYSSSQCTSIIGLPDGVLLVLNIKSCNSHILRIEPQGIIYILSLIHI